MLFKSCSLLSYSSHCSNRSIRSTVLSFIQVYSRNRDEMWLLIKCIDVLSKHIRCRENLHPVKELSITLKENETVPSAVVSRTKSSMRISIWDGGFLGLRKKLGFEISLGGGRVSLYTVGNGLREESLVLTFGGDVFCVDHSQSFQVLHEKFQWGRGVIL